jgi:hypothetical protein
MTGVVQAPVSTHYLKAQLEEFRWAISASEFLKVIE